MIMHLVKTCPLCGGESVIDVDEDKYIEYVAGIKDGRSAQTHGIQVIFADRTPGEREQIKTGIHEKCWDELFGSS